MSKSKNWHYIRSESYDAAFNLALEQYVFDCMPRSNSYVMLWRNANAVIVGKHQNTVEEINAPFVKEHGIQVVRRLSGGGAVYHDLGNINFTFITRKEWEDLDFAFFCHPVAEILQSLGVNAKISGRNDMSIDGMKFSGNSQYIKQGRIMHHGTIMFDSDLGILSQTLSRAASPQDMVSKDKIESRGLKSKRSRVTNVRLHVVRDCSTEEFMNTLELELVKRLNAEMIPFESINTDEVHRLRLGVYNTWEWNYGSSPPYNICKKRVFEGVGEIELRMEVAGGRIRALVFYGDFFSKRDLSELTDALIGIKVNEASLLEALKPLQAEEYIRNLRNEDLASMFEDIT